MTPVVVAPLPQPSWQVSVTDRPGPAAATAAARGAVAAATAVAAAVASRDGGMMEQHHVAFRTSRGNPRSPRCLATSLLLCCLCFCFFMLDAIVGSAHTVTFTLSSSCGHLVAGIQRHQRWLGSGRKSLRSVALAATQESDMRTKDFQDAYRAVEGAVSQKAMEQRRFVDTSRTWRKESVNWPDAEMPKWNGEEWEANVRFGHNKLFDTDKNGFPKYGEISHIHAKRGITWVTHKSGNELWGLYSAPTSQPGADFSWREIMFALEYVTDMHDRVWASVKFIKDVVNPSADMDKVWEYIARIRLYSQRRVWRCEKFMPKFKALLENDRTTEAQRRVVANQLIIFQRGGVNLQAYGFYRDDPKAFMAFKVVYRQLSNISLAWELNVEKDMERKAVVIRDKYDLNGLPMHVIEDALQAARTLGYPKATLEKGPWMITMDDALVEPVLRYAQARGIREAVYTAYHRIGWRGGAGKGDNGPYLTAMLDLRLELANILGYQSYADMMFTTRMASVRQAYGFLARMRKESKKAAQRELGELREFAKSQGEQAELEHFDLDYWRQKLLEQRYSLQEDYLRQFFPIDAVLEGLFATVKRLFGVEVVAGDGEVHVWDEHVRFFRLREVDGGAEVASFFLDPFRRRGSKRPGFWVEKIHGYSRVLGDVLTGAPRLPALHIIGDIPAPPVLPDGTNGTALLTPKQVEKMFYHMGEALRTLLCNVSEGLVAGTNGMEAEAVAIPAHLMQRFAFEPSVLKKMGRHFETGDPLPDAAIETLAASRALHNGMRVLKQTAAAQIDLDLHAQFDPNGTMNVFEVVKLIEGEFAVMPPRIEDYDICKSDIDKSEHATAAYADLWSEALACDAFAEFEEVIDDEKALQETGRRFRRAILAPGAGRAPGAAFRDFHGRGLTLAPFEHYLGLDGPEDVEEYNDDIKDVVVTGEDAEYESYSEVYDDEDAEDDDLEMDGVAPIASSVENVDDNSYEDNIDADYYEDDVDASIGIPPTAGEPPAQEGSVRSADGDAKPRS